jgi:phosphohistidine phosphatase
MHRLHLLRHAKSSWEEGVEDHARPLDGRGRDEAKRVGRHLPAAIGHPDLVLCSSAARARETMEWALAGFSPMPRRSVEDGLYLVGAAILLQRLARLDERDEAVLVIGHNPGLHELAVALADPDSKRFRAMAQGKFPTSVRASFAIEGPWASIGRSRHAMVDYVTVKSIED